MKFEEENVNYKNSKNQMGKETSCKNLVTTDSAHGEVEGMGETIMMTVFAFHYWDQNSEPVIQCNLKF